MTSSPPSDAEFTRKLALGILSILNQKGLLTSEEVDAILYTARRAAQAAELAAPISSVQRGPLSDPQPQVQRVRRSLSDPQPPFRHLGLSPAAPHTAPPQAAAQTPEDEAAPPPLPVDDEAARADEARWVRKEPLPPPTFDIEV